MSTYQFGNAFKELMKIMNQREIVQDEVTIIKDKFPMYRSPIKIEEVITETLAARAIAANDLWEMKTGKRQKIAIDEEAAGALCSLGTPMTQRKNKNGEYEPISNAKKFFLKWLLLLNIGNAKMADGFYRILICLILKEEV